MTPSPTSLAYVERGRGAPLVLLHAFPLSRAMWDAQLARWSDRWRVIVPDLPGFGESDRNPPPSIARMAAAVEELLDGLEVEGSIVLAGLSMGGYAAFEFARQFPERLRALILISTRVAADTPQQREGRMRMIERLRREGWGAPIIESVRSNLLGRTTLEARPEVVAQVTALMQEARVEGVIDALYAMAERRDSTPLLSKLHCPALVIAGAEDSLIGPEEGRLMAAALRARFELLPGIGHLANLEQPALFHDAVEAFLEQLRTEDRLQA